MNPVVDALRRELRIFLELRPDPPAAQMIALSTLQVDLMLKECAETGTPPLATLEAHFLRMRACLAATAYPPTYAGVAAVLDLGDVIKALQQLQESAGKVPPPGNSDKP